MRQRRQFWIDSSIQWPITRSLLASSIFSAVYAAIISFVVGSMAGFKAGGIEDVSQVFNWLFRFQAVTIMTMLVGFSCLIALMSWWGVRSSHKIAGPLVPIQRALENARQGNFEEPIQIRQGDWLHDFVEELNLTLKAIGERQQGLEQKIQELGGEIQTVETDPADTQESPD